MQNGRITANVPIDFRRGTRLFWPHGGHGDSFQAPH
jgi:hypothetical protein